MLQLSEEISILADQLPSFKHLLKHWTCMKLHSACASVLSRKVYKVDMKVRPFQRFVRYLDRKLSVSITNILLFLLKKEELSEFQKNLSVSTGKYPKLA
jgi:hypothetical protein